MMYAKKPPTLEEWLVINELSEYPPDISKAVQEQLTKIAKAINSTDKTALVRSTKTPTFLGRKVDETEIELPYGDRKSTKLFVTEKPYGFDCAVTVSTLIHWIDDDFVEVEKDEKVASFSVVTQNVEPYDLLIVAEAQVSLFEWIHQPLYVTLAEFLESKTNELNLLISEDLVIFHVPGFYEAYNPFGGAPLKTPNYFALRKV